MTADQRPGPPPGLFLPPMSWVLDQLDWALTESRRIITGKSKVSGADITEQSELFAVAYGMVEQALTDMIPMARELLEADAHDAGRL